MSPALTSELKQLDLYVLSHYLSTPKYSVNLRDAIQEIDAAMENQTTFAECLFDVIAKKHLSDVEVYKKARIDRRIFSKIRTQKDYMPSKKTVLALAIALQQNPYEASKLLSCAGYSLSNARKEDLVVEYFLARRCFDMDLINEALTHYGFSTLGE